MTTALLEPFESFFNWSTNIGWTIVAGRTGNCFQTTSASVTNYTIPPPLEADKITLGFAWQISSLAAVRQLLVLSSDANLVPHLTFIAKTDGSIEVRRGNASGTIIGTTATGLVTINTWNYIEVQAVLSDTVGTVVLNFNTVNRLNLTGQDTKQGGTKTTWDTVRIGNITTVTALYDDMYVAMGPGESFRGSQVITPLSAAVLADQNARVGFTTGAPVATDIIRHVMQESRVGFLSPIGPFKIESFRQSIRALTQAPTQPTQSLLSYRQSVRVLTSLVTPAPTTPMVKVWSGSAWVDAPVRVWSGSAWVDAAAVRTWNGSAFV